MAVAAGRRFLCSRSALVRRRGAMLEWRENGRQFNARTPAFGTVNPGSHPGLPANGGGRGPPLFVFPVRSGTAARGHAGMAGEWEIVQRQNTGLWNRKSWFESRSPGKWRWPRAAAFVFPVRSGTAARGHARMAGEWEIVQRQNTGLWNRESWFESRSPSRSS